MVVESLLMQIIIIPLVASALTLLLGKRMGRHCGWIAFFGLLYATCILAIFGIELFRNPSKAYAWSFEWVPGVGLRFGLLADGLSLPFALTISLLSTLIAVYSISYMEHEHGSSVYFTLYTFYAIGMIGAVLSTNLIQFFFFFEIMLLPSWALINSWGTGARERIALKYFIFTHLGALSLLIGILATYSILGTLDLAEIPSMMQSRSPPSWILQAIVLTMLIGFFVKLAIFPVHTWLPDAHAEAPTPISALLSPAMIGIGGYAIARIILTYFRSTALNLSTSLSLLALVTMIYGGLMALAQDDIKRLLAYSSISQMGYLLFGLASFSAIGITGSMFHYVSHGTCKAILFMVSGVFMHQVGIRSISKLGGLAGKMPYTAISMMIGFLGIAGTPPLNGFQSEWMIFLGAFYYGFYINNIQRVLMAALAVIASILTVGYALWTIRRILFGPLPENLKTAKEAPLTMTVPLIVLAFVTFLLGIYPRIFTDMLLLVADKVAVVPR